MWFITSENPLTTEVNKNKTRMDGLQETDKCFYNKISQTSENTSIQSSYTTFSHICSWNLATYRDNWKVKNTQQNMEIPLLGIQRLKDKKYIRRKTGVTDVA